MKRYLLVLSGLELGGSERQAINLAKYLKSTGRYVTILGLTAPGMVNEICRKENIECVSMPSGDRLTCHFLSIVSSLNKIFFNKQMWIAGEALMRRLARFIKKGNYDVCISYCTYANTILGCAQRYYSQPVYVWYQRDAGIFDETEGYQKKSIQCMNYVLANGRSGQEWIRRAYGVDAKIIYNGVVLCSPEISRAGWREKLKADESTVVCTMIANLSGAKDHLSVLKIWTELQRIDITHKLILVLAGRFDDQYESLQKFVDGHNLSEQVLFLGEVRDISGLLTATDICIFGAKSEGSPNGIIEASFAGLPVVATDLPEIREVLAEINYKFLFQRDDISCALEGLLKLAENIELREQIGLMNREKAEAMFSYEKNFNKIIDLVETE